VRCCLSTLKTSKIKKALLKKAFKNDSTHHEMYWLVVGDQKRSIRTRISNGQKNANDWLQHQIARQLKLTISQFKLFVECGITGEDYAALMIQPGHVTAQGTVSIPRKS
jgi:hypothetical protein